MPLSLKPTRAPTLTHGCHLVFPRKTSCPASSGSELCITKLCGASCLISRQGASRLRVSSSPDFLPWLQFPILHFNNNSEDELWPKKSALSEHLGAQGSPRRPGRGHLTVLSPELLPSLETSLLSQSHHSPHHCPTQAGGEAGQIPAAEETQERQQPVPPAWLGAASQPASNENNDEWRMQNWKYFFPSFYRSSSKRPCSWHLKQRDCFNVVALAELELSNLALRDSQRPFLQS